MIFKELIFLFFIIILLVILIAFMIHKYPENFRGSQELKEPDCICAFDIDGTITTGIDRAAKAIKRCKELGAKIAINTARPTKWYSDLDLDGLGVSHIEIDSEFYHGEPFACSFTDIKCFENAIAGTKVKHLYTLSSKWNVRPERIILFDDQWSNVAMAKEAGFSAIHANYHLGGLPDNVVDQIENILI
jgi:3-deoxy-D-manno-octulosonate 8-phosphate phosphatase KdsC-like HAD superfamily phosphatase